MNWTQWRLLLRGKPFETAPHIIAHVPPTTSESKTSFKSTPKNHLGVIGTFGLGSLIRLYKPRAQSRKIRRLKARIMLQTQLFFRMASHSNQNQQTEEKRAKN